MESKYPTLQIHSVRSLVCFMVAMIVNGFALGLLGANALSESPNPALSSLAIALILVVVGLLFLGTTLRKRDVRGRQIV